MRELKKSIEAILFSSGKYLTLEEIAGLCKKNPDETRHALLELQAELEGNKDTPLVLLNEGNMWKLTTREEYSHLVRGLISETDLTKSQMETLATIAFKYPIKQSELIRIRTNKAYDHLTELERLGFIIRQRYGRSKLIKLSEKFFEYFDLPHDKLKQRFKGFEQLAKTIESKEHEIVKLKEEQREKAEEEKRVSEKERKIADGNFEIDLVDENGKEYELKVYETEKQEQKLGNLDVVEAEKKEEEIKEKEIDKEKEKDLEKAGKKIDEFFESRKDNLE
ncbi:SMC-Scp complex subunit ScpB [Candidatus Woesearchaeota archaeon]|nr:SMC-Scp complex subunit ScpB [Candidatus Woesearchaeota archaeon]